METPYFLGIIPARGGSKGIINKNLRKINGKSLVTLAIECAKESKLLTDWLVSTDSIKIAEEVKRQGVDIPFIRPVDLATDSSSTADVVKHAIEFHESSFNCKVDYAVLIQPTSPFRISKDIDDSIRMILDYPDVNSLISCHMARSSHPVIMYIANNNRMSPLLSEALHQRRQDYSPVFVRNGIVYIVKRDFVLKEGKMRDNSPLGYIVPESRAMNIDDPIDLMLAECMSHKINNQDI